MDKVEKILDRMKEIGNYESQKKLADALGISSSALTQSKDNNALSPKILNKFYDIHPQTNKLYLEWGLKSNTVELDKKYIDYAKLIQEYEEDSFFLDNILRPLHLQQEKILNRIINGIYDENILKIGLGADGLKKLSTERKEWVLNNKRYSLLSLGFCFGKDETDSYACLNCLKCPYFLTTKDFIPIFRFMNSKLDRLSNYFLQNNISDSKSLFDQEELSNFLEKYTEAT